jgi:hypothetical protein
MALDPSPIPLGVLSTEKSGDPSSEGKLPYTFVTYSFMMDERLMNGYVKYCVPLHAMFGKFPLKLLVEKNKKYTQLRQHYLLSGPQR